MNNIFLFIFYVICVPLFNVIYIFQRSLISFCFLNILSLIFCLNFFNHLVGWSLWLKSQVWAYFTGLILSIIDSRFYHPVSSKEQTCPIFCEKHFGAVVSTSVKLGNHWLVFAYTLACNDSLMACRWLRAPRRRHRSCCSCQWQRAWGRLLHSGERPWPSSSEQPQEACLCAGAAPCPHDLVFPTVFWEHENLNKCGKCELSLFFFFLNYRGSLISYQINKNFRFTKKQG